MEQDLINLIEGTITKLGFNLLEVKIAGGKVLTINIIIERLDKKPLGTDDCQTVSRNIAPLLDVNEAIRGHYMLEISSAGSEVILNSMEDFMNFLGNKVQITLNKTTKGKKNFTGKLMDVSNDKITIAHKGFPKKIYYSNIESGKII